MTASKFTPGPWKFVGGNQIRSAIHQIAKVWMMRNGEGRANAHLIAAAPELFSALDRLVLIADYYVPESAQLTMDAARGALAKALGEECPRPPTSCRRFR